MVGDERHDPDGWITFDGGIASHAAVAGPSNTPSETAAPVVIKFDEATGQQLNTQVQFNDQKNAVTPTYKLPWRHWRAEQQAMGAVEADRAATVAMLHTIHENYDVQAQPVHMVQTEKCVTVIASTAVAVGEISLPPCVPKQMSVQTKTEHPHAVKIHMQVMNPATDSVQTDATTVMRELDLWIIPEFKAPKPPPTAVADADAPSLWQWRGDETMHPFWAVRWMTDAECSDDAIVQLQNQVG